MARPHSPWRQHTESKSDSSSSASVSAICADQLLLGPCPSEYSRGRSIGHELDQGPTSSDEQFTENFDCERPARLNKCESLGSGKQLILHGNPSAIVRDFSPHIWQSFGFFCRMCTSSAVCCFRAPAVAILTSLRPAVNPLLGCASGEPVQDQLAWVGFVL